MKGKWHTRVAYACPKCEYDVTQTLADRIARCPECGDPVSQTICTTVLKRLGSWARAGLCVLWMSPIVLSPLATVIVMDVVLGPYRRRRSMQFGGVQIDLELFAWLLLGATTALCEVGCYLLWWRVEHWRSKRGAAKRAVWRTAIVAGIQAASAGIVIGIIVMAVQMLG